MNVVVMVSHRIPRLILLPTITSGVLLHTTLFEAQCEDKTKSPASKTSFGSFTYPANNPSEDRHIYGHFGSWKYCGVFDGHGGWQVSDLSSKRLIHLVAKHFSSTSSSLKEFDEVKIEKALTQSFEEMEKEIVTSIRPAFELGFGDVAKVGSCVLLAFHQNDRLVIANCGDCRAVLGSTPHHAVTINRDHNCRVPLEQALLREKHPNEQNLVVCKSSRACYVKGRLQLTRSLGDAYLKYREFNGSGDPNRPVGRHLAEPYTPPYLSHVPEVHHVRLTSEDRFVILGSDGVWDYLPQDEAVSLVFQAQRSGLTENQAAQLLVERALQIASAESGMTLEELLALPQGRQRRSRHDDTTVVVMYF